MPEGDIIGNTTHPSAYVQFADAGTPGLTDGTIAFRVRVAADSGPAGFGRACEVGLDLTGDGKLDAFIGLNNSGRKLEIGIYDTGTGANNSPSTTSISATPTYQYTQTSVNYSWAAVTTTNDPSVGTATDIDGGRSPDMFVSFSIPFADLVAYLNTKGITANQNSSVSYVIATSTQGNSLNQDLNGVTGGNSSSSLFSTLGAISKPSTVSGLTVPQITSASSTTFTRGSAGTFLITTTGNPAPAITATGSLPVGLTFTDNGNGTATLAGTATGSGGVYTLTLTAVNGASPNATQNFTLTVNEAPTITSGNITTFVNGVAGTFTVRTTGYPNPVIAAGGALPPGVTVVDNGDGTATLSGTATGTAGSYALVFTAANVVSPTATQSFTLVIDEAPQITSGNASTFYEGQMRTFTVTTTGSPTVVIGFSGTLPSGVSFQDNGDGTGTVSGRPGFGSKGTYAVTLSGSNGVNPDATQAFTLTVTEIPNPTPTPTPEPSATPTPTATPAPIGVSLLNLSGRANEGPEDDVTIGGFIIAGSENKTVVLRGIGPSLADAGVSNFIQDPVLELFDGSGRRVGVNDNWKDDPQNGAIPEGLKPTQDGESAMYRSLPPGNYTVALRGKGAQTGVGLAEIYDVDRAHANSRLANVSTRGITRGGEDVLIAGFIVTGDTRKKVVVRGIAPSLENVMGTIKQPVISMYDEQGSMLERNAGWKSSGGAAQVANTGWHHRTIERMQSTPACGRAVTPSSAAK